LSSIKNKTNIKTNKIKSIAKYKNRSLTCLLKNNARISQAYFNSIKHGFLNYLQNTYEKLNLRKNKNTDALLIKNFINKNLKELTITNPNSLNLNIALRRFTQHFKDLFSKNINISLQI
jgi:hypothetical protein